MPATYRQPQHVQSKPGRSNCHNGVTASGTDCAPNADPPWASAVGATPQHQGGDCPTAGSRKCAEPGEVGGAGLQWVRCVKCAFDF